MQPTAAMSPSLNFLDGAANLYDASHDFMAGNARINGGHELFPFVAHGVQIGMANSAKENFDLNILGTRGAAVME